MTEWVKNSVTGQMQTTSQCTVKSISENVLKNTGPNQTEFRIVDVVLPNGKVRGARALEQHLDRIAVGDVRLLNITAYKDKDGMDAYDLQVAPIGPSVRATAEDLDFITLPTGATANTGTPEPVESKVNAPIKEQVAEGVKQ